MSEYLAPFEAMLDTLFPPGRIRAIDAGADWSDERAEVEKSGFLEALASEDGLPIGDVVTLWRALGYRAAPLAIGETMIDRSEQDADLAKPLLLAAAISGAADRVLSMTVDHANQRVQFGKPIGRQQAVQQQLAVMAEYVVAVRMSLDLASSGDWPTAEKAALAKVVAAIYAPQIANAAHAVHGAIGISADYDLQLYTRRLHTWRLEGGGETAWARKLGGSILSASDSSLDWMRRLLF